MMEVNYLGTVNVARTLVPVLIQSGRRREPSILALVASVAGLRGIPMLAGYSASKFAVVGFAQALRDEIYDEPIQVRVICPPAVDTPMVQNLAELPPVYRLSPPQPVEKVVTALLAQVERLLANELAFPLFFGHLVEVAFVLVRAVSEPVPDRLGKGPDPRERPQQAAEHKRQQA